jgi:gliding motility-associated-like protein
MKNFIVIIFCSIIFLGNSYSQVVISADTTWGCGELKVSFSLSPENVYDTITSLVWSFGDGEPNGIENTPVHDYKQPGKYYPSALLNNTSLVTFKTSIDVHFEPNVFFSWEDTAALGPYYVLLKAGEQQPTDTLIYTYTWKIPNNPAVSGNKLVYDFGETGLYSVLLTVSHNYGCISSLRQDIAIANKLECPNVFTPNQDGINDFFKVSTNGINLYSFSVYTRSGALIYKTESLQVEWDGRSLSGHEVQAGIYYYLIEQLDGDNKPVKKGFVHLLK